MYTVSVLLSTFNGEKYIEDLIKSVLKQVNVEVRLIIRDDGSSDSTIDIINAIADNRITLYQGENVGPAKSFLDLIKYAPKAEFYAFCDQDDVWYEDKLFRAVQKLNTCVPDKPSLYMSTFDVMDEEGNFLYKCDMGFAKPFTLAQTVMARCANGCVMVFNHILRDLLKKSAPKHMRMHDYWVLLTAEAFQAEIVTDDVATLSYRQHTANVVGADASKGEKFRRLMNSVLNNRNERMLQAKSVYEEYEELLPEESKKLLLKVICYKKKFWNRFCLIRDKRFRWNTYTDILFIGAVLMGVF